MTRVRLKPTNLGEALAIDERSKKHWIPTPAGMTRMRLKPTNLAEAPAIDERSQKPWIPAFAGMTNTRPHGPAAPSNATA
jgi:hypothetical protein